jgi:hypothetical protein
MDATTTTAFSYTDIPSAVLPYPTDTWGRIKYSFWRGITPHFLRIRDALVKFHILHHHGRQHFKLGKVLPPKSIPAFIAHLQSEGFGNHFIAWRDEGQLVSLRKLDGFERQYHLRIFQDGEVSGHYEYTPEAHPWLHFKERDLEERRKDFSVFLDGWVGAK